MGNNQKILFVDTGLQGHHQTYLHALMEAFGGRSVICAPAGGDSIYTEAERYYAISNPYKSWRAYFKLISQLAEIVNIEKPDVVHLVFGDALFRFGGVGFDLIHAKKLITFHHVRYWNKLSIGLYRRFSKKSEKMVFHTEFLVKNMIQQGIRNITHIEYPQFTVCSQVDQRSARAKIGLPDDNMPVILALGGTRYLKGIDILLKALADVQAPFYLLIAGAPEYFDEQAIRNYSESYKERVFTKLKFLSEEEVDLCLKACDIVCLPYRKKFNGASGPLGEGVYRGKLIVGPNHGSVGEIIRDHHLGLTFKTEDVSNLSTILNQALQMVWYPDDYYNDYKSQLDPRCFKEEYKKLYHKILR